MKITDTERDETILAGRNPAIDYVEDALVLSCMGEGILRVLKIEASPQEAIKLAGFFQAMASDKIARRRL